MYCTNCGAPAHINAKFCINCGQSAAGHLILPDKNVSAMVPGRAKIKVQANKIGFFGSVFIVFGLVGCFGAPVLGIMSLAVIPWWGALLLAAFVFFSNAQWIFWGKGRVKFLCPICQKQISALNMSSENVKCGKCKCLIVLDWIPYTKNWNEHTPETRS